MRTRPRAPTRCAVHDAPHSPTGNAHPVRRTHSPGAHDAVHSPRRCADRCRSARHPPARATQSDNVQGGYGREIPPLGAPHRAHIRGQPGRLAGVVQEIRARSWPWSRGAHRMRRTLVKECGPTAPARASSPCVRKSRSCSHRPAHRDAHRCRGGERAASSVRVLVRRVRCIAVRTGPSWRSWRRVMMVIHVREARGGMRPGWVRELASEKKPGLEQHAEAVVLAACPWPIRRSRMGGARVQNSTAPVRILMRENGAGVVTTEVSRRCG